MGTWFLAGVGRARPLFFSSWAEHADGGCRGPAPLGHGVREEGAGRRGGAREKKQPLGVVVAVGFAWPSGQVIGDVDRAADGAAALLHDATVLDAKDGARGRGADAGTAARGIGALELPEGRDGVGDGRARRRGAALLAGLERRGRRDGLFVLGRRAPHVPREGRCTALGLAYAVVCIARGTTQCVVRSSSFLEAWARRVLPTAAGLDGLRGHAGTTGAAAGPVSILATPPD